MVKISIVKPVLWLTLILLMFLVCTSPLQLVSLEVPAHVPLGTRAALSCRWQLGPADVLYSVKWYKDGKEFFRHVPRDAEPRRRFPLPGVDVEDSDPSGSHLVLSPASLETGGRFRCEVSGERPLFPTVSHHADMDVIAVPEHGPVISGFNPKYDRGDKVRINCTSGHSQPATQLSWYINGELIPSDQYTTSYRSDHALIVTCLILEFEVTEMHFRKNKLKVKCLSTITPVYWRSSEETAVLEKTNNNREHETISQTEKAKRNHRSHVNFANKDFRYEYNLILIFLPLGVITVLSRM